VSAVGEELGLDRALRIEEAILEMEEDDFVFGVAIAGEDLVGLSAFGPFASFFTGRMPRTITRVSGSLLRKACAMARMPPATLRGGVFMPRSHFTFPPSLCVTP
jgi:hypothetical protein